MRVLIAISDRDFARAILNFIESRQWSDDTTMRAIHVLDEPVAVTKTKRAKSFRSYDDHHKHHVKLLEDFVCGLKKGVPMVAVEKSLLIGFPEVQILKVAEEWQPDLIILGSHGRRGLERDPWQRQPGCGRKVSYFSGDSKTDHPDAARLGIM